MLSIVRHALPVALYFAVAVTSIAWALDGPWFDAMECGFATGLCLGILHALIRRHLGH